MSVLDSDVISGAYFFPRPITCPEAIEVEVDGATLSCLYYVTDANRPTLVHFHGNGETIQDYVNMGFPRWIESALPGINLLMIEYRGYGGSSGRASLVSMLPDGHRVLEALSVRAERAIVYGRSIGSLYAIELASRCPSLAGLVVESGIANIRERFLERPNIRGAIEDWDAVDREISEHFDHEQKMAGYCGRVLIMHTRLDDVVDMSHGRRLYGWSGCEQKRLVEFLHGDHSSILLLNGQIILASVARLFNEAFPDSQFDASIINDPRLAVTYSVTETEASGDRS